MNQESLYVTLGINSLEECLNILKTQKTAVLSTHRYRQGRYEELGMRCKSMQYSAGRQKKIKPYPWGIYLCFMCSLSARLNSSRSC